MQDPSYSLSKNRLRVPCSPAKRIQRACTENFISKKFSGNKKISQKFFPRSGNFKKNFSENFLKIFSRPGQKISGTGILFRSRRKTPPETPPKKHIFSRSTPSPIRPLYEPRFPTFPERSPVRARMGIRRPPVWSESPGSFL